MFSKWPQIQVFKIPRICEDMFGSRHLKAMDPVTVLTDCAGMEAPLQALKNLGVPFTKVVKFNVMSCLIGGLD
jgi:hypothetical protein